MLTEDGFHDRQRTATYEKTLRFPDGDQIHVSVSRHAFKRLSQRFFTNCSELLVDWLRDDLKLVLEATYDAADLQKICIFNEARGSVIWYTNLWSQ